MIKTYTSKALAILMSAALFLGSCGFFGSAYAEGERTYNGYAIKTGTLKVPDVSVAQTYYYSDGYFTQSATVDNEHLYTMSMMLSSVVSSQKACNRTSTILKDMGFGGRYDNYTDVTPTENTIGVVTAYKKVKIDGEYVYIVPVAIRGGCYESEWMGNAVIGTSGNAQNFQACADTVVNEVTTNVINKNNIPADKVKIWITGYSRGAAVANLAAKTFSDTYGMDDVYAYCLETPRCATGNLGNYTNIRNVIYEDDAITYVAPEQFGFGWYGQVKTLSNNTANMNEYARQLYLIDSSYAPDDNFVEYSVKIDSSIITNVLKGEDALKPVATGSNLTQKEFIKNTLDKITGEWNIIPSRDYYVNTVVENGDTIQNTLKIVLDLVINGDTDKMSDALVDAAKASIGYSVTIVNMITKGPDKVLPVARNAVYNKVWSEFKNAGGTEGLSEEQIAALDKCKSTLIYIAADAIHKDYVEGGKVVGTLINNHKRIAYDHEHIKILAFLRTEDHYYMTDIHSLSKVDKVKATVDQDGSIEYWTCPVCGTIYTDAAGNNEVTSDRLGVAKIDASSVDLEKDSYVFDGKDKEPQVSVKDANGKALSEGTDFTVSYSNNKETGTAKATISFTGDYSGTIEKNFLIVSDYSISGKITGGNGNVKLQFVQDNMIMGNVEVKNGEYSFNNIKEGKVTVKVSSEGYVTRTYEFNINEAINIDNLVLRQYGDANLDGVRDASDVTAIARHIAKISTLKDSYQFLVVDTNKDSSVDAEDVTRLAKFIAHIITDI